MTQEVKDYNEEEIFVSLGEATELTLGNGCNTFENFGCKYCNCH